MTAQELLASRPAILADGAMGTELHRRGASLEVPFDLLNLTDPDRVRQVHLDYIFAGAELITTNTFGANPIRLASHGLAERTRAINLEGVKIARHAREIAGLPVLIAGDIGPVGKALQPLGPLSEQEVLDALRRQVEALLAGGVDLFLIETQSDPRELLLAVRAVRELSRLPVVAEMSFSAEGRALYGASPRQMAGAIQELAADQRPQVVGVNCGAGPAPVLEAILQLRQALADGGVEVRLSAMPNAGHPTRVGDRWIYMAIPSYFAEFARRFVEAGVQLVGGCCGTTPEHIRAMRQALDEMGHTLPEPWAQALREHEARRAAAGSGVGARPFVAGEPKSVPPASAGQGAVQVRAPRAQAAPEAVAVSSPLPEDSVFARPGHFIVSVELDPPRGPVPQKVVEGARAVKAAGADLVNVGDSPMAQVRMSSLATAHLIRQQAGIETILHFTTRDRNLMGIQADLLGAHAIGVRHILALTGDPPALGNYAHATAVYDVDSIGLVHILTQLNHGVDVAGRSIGQPTRFAIGVAVNPASPEVETELARFRRKLQAGAHFAMTQPLFEVEVLLRFLDRLGGCPVPVLLGVLPLRSYQHAEYLHNEVPGIFIPEPLREELRRAGDGAEQLGLEIALRVALEARPYVAGVYIIPSFGRYEQACQLVRALRQAVGQAAGQGRAAGA